MAIYVPDTDTAHEFGELWPAHVWASLETFTKMYIITTPNVVQELQSVDEIEIDTKLEDIVQCEIRWP